MKTLFFPALQGVATPAAGGFVTLDPAEIFGARGPIIAARIDKFCKQQKMDAPNKTFALTAGRETLNGNLEKNRAIIRTITASGLSRADKEQWVDYLGAINSRLKRMARG